MNLKKFLFIALIILTIPNCKSPGIDEPIALIYVIRSDGTAECYPKEICPHESRPVDDMIGFQCAGPRAAAEINTHHDILHRALNECLIESGRKNEPSTSP